MIVARPGKMCRKMRFWHGQVLFWRFFAFFLGFFVFSASGGDIWNHLMTTDTFAYALGTPHTNWINLEVGEGGWDANDIGIGVSPSDPAGYAWQVADWYADGEGQNKQTHTAFTNVSRLGTGTWYYVGRSRKDAVDPWHYANDTNWDHTTSFAPVYAFDITNLPAATGCAVSNSGTGPEALALGWQPQGSYQVMVVRRAGSGPSAPVNGTAYTNGALFGSSTRVVYTGNANAMTDYGLEPETTYHYAFFTENYSYYSSATGVVASGGTMFSAPSAFRSGENVEAFSYNAATRLNGSDGGRNWSNAWIESTPGSFVVSNNSFGQTTGFPTNYGNKVWVHPSDGTSETARRNFDGITTGKFYAAYIMNYTWSGNTKWCGMSFVEGTAEKAFFGEISSADTKLGLTVGVDNTESSTTLSAGPGNDYIIFGKYDFNTRKLQTLAYAVGGSVPAAEPAEWAATQTLSAGAISRIDGLRLGAGATSGRPGDVYFDEVRFATNWWGLLGVAPQTPTLNASDIAFGSVSTNSMTVSWSRGNGDAVLVVGRSGSAPVDPTDGTGYSASATFGAGTDIGGSGSFVVYQGADTSVSVEGLASGTNYYFKVYEFNGVGALSAYRTSDEPSDNQATLSPIIDVQGNGTTIANGDATPSDADHTAFGEVNTTAATQIRTYTIYNDGNTDLHLSGTPRVELSGADADQFTVNSQPSTPVSQGGGSETFQITFDPSTAGSKTATVSIDNTDYDETPYTFTIQGTSIEPDVKVLGIDLSEIPDGDGTPQVADGTDFGSNRVTVGYIEHTFTVTNEGTTILNITGVTTNGTHPGDFIVTNQPAASIPAGGATAFTLRFDPTALGSRSAVIHVATDDPDTPDYDFTVQGLGVEPEIAVLGIDLSVINDGDATPSVADGTDFTSNRVSVGFIEHDFTVTNAGTTLLTLTGVTTNGAHPGDFIVTTPPDASVPAGESSVFTVRFDPD
ncbi:MAG: choice-of-anchor D domain-containing protein, partial [Spartobacteria bacterium]|nr:choice-of-anchor D domain-containing protein [Spartobacteria bacterium]